MKLLSVLTWTFVTLLSIHQVVGQTTFQRADQQSLEGFLQDCHPAEDGYVSLAPGNVSVLNWGNPSAGEKIVYLYAAPGKDVVSGEYSYYEDGPLLLMVMQHGKAREYVSLESEMAANEIVLGAYPRTVFIDSATTADLDDDGIQECIVRLNGSQRCPVEFEEENPETGEVEIIHTTATCDYYGFAILRQEKRNGQWHSSFSMEWMEFGEEEDDTGNFLSFPELIRSLK